jgi:hypothetical protein
MGTHYVCAAVERLEHKWLREQQIVETGKFLFIAKIIATVSTGLRGSQVGFQVSSRSPRQMNGYWVHCMATVLRHLVWRHALAMQPPGVCRCPMVL